MSEQNQRQICKSRHIGRLISVLYEIFKRFSPLFAFIFSLILFVLLFKINDIYPFGEKSIAWCDANQQFIPLLCDFKDVLSGKEGFFYSFQNAGGMNFFGVFFFNLSSPFSFLVVFFEKSEMSDCFNLMTILKISCAALTFAIFLKDRLKNYPCLVIFFSLIYAFSGYTMMYYQILQWIDVVYTFPLILLGLEKMTEGKSFLLYGISLLFCVVFQFYLSYAVVVFVSLYAAVYAILNREKAKKFCFSFISGSLFAALLSAAVLLPCFMQYLSSMRTSDIMATLKGSNIFPSGSTSYPTFFCLAFACTFAILYIVKNYKSHLAILTLLCVVPVFFEPVAKAWQTFNYMAFPTRYGFILIALVLYIGAKQIAEMLDAKEIKAAGKTQFFINETENGNAENNVFVNFINNHKTLIKIFTSVIVIAFCTLFSIFAYRYYEKNQEILTAYSHSLWGNAESFKALAKYAAIPLIAGAACLLLTRYDLIPKIAVYALIAALCIVECAFSCNVYMISAKNNAYSLKKAAKIENVIEDDEFFRVKNNVKLFDVNLTGAMGYGSLAHYTSLNDRLYMHTVKQLGYSSYWMEVNSNGGTVFTDALLRNKYTVHSGSESGAFFVSEPINGARVSVKQNEYCFPFGFYIKDGETFKADETLERREIQNALYEKLTGDSGLYTKYEPELLSNVVDLSDDERFSYQIVTQSEPAKIIYSIKITQPVALYFDLFDEYTNNLREPYYSKISSVRVTVGGLTRKSIPSYPTQSNNGTAFLGNYSHCVADVTVTLTDSVSANTFGLFSVATTKLKNAINEAIGGDFNKKPNGISGKINAPDDGYVFFAVPYNQGFKAKVNGKNAEVNEFNGFMTVKVQKGENKVELNFKPEGFTAGICISVIGLILGALYFCIFKEKIEQNEKINTITNNISFYCVLALGAVVIFVIYLFPLGVNIFAA